MTPGGQSQRAGQGSNQIQVTGDLIVHNGINEERAREISRAASQEIREESVAEALALVETRLAAFDDRIMNVLGHADQLNAFGDPGFYRTFRKAQEGAAASDRDSDQDVLAALLVDRAKSPRDRQNKAGVERAIEIVDRVDDDALRALTVIWSFYVLGPAMHPVEDTLVHFDRHFARLLDGGTLPTGDGWIDHLDILNAVRIDPVNGFRKFDDYYPSRFVGWLAPGLPADQVPESMELPGGFLPWALVTRDHELRPGFKRVTTGGVDQFRTFLASFLLGPEQIDAAVRQAEQTFGLGQIEEPLKVELATRIRQLPTYGLVADWWDQIPTASTLTAVGRALAKANALRLDQSGFLPKFNEPGASGEQTPDSTGGAD